PYRTLFRSHRGKQRLSEQSVSHRILSKVEEGVERGKPPRHRASAARGSDEVGATVRTVAVLTSGDITRRDFRQVLDLDFEEGVVYGSLHLPCCVLMSAPAEGRRVGDLPVCAAANAWASAASSTARLTALGTCPTTCS